MIRSSFTQDFVVHASVSERHQFRCQGSKPLEKTASQNGCVTGWWFGTFFPIYPIGSMYGIYANIGGILMVNVTIYSIHGSYGYWEEKANTPDSQLIFCRGG